MEEEAMSKILAAQSGAGDATDHGEKAETEANPKSLGAVSSSVGPKKKTKKKFTPDEKRAAWTFLHAAMKVVEQYNDMTEEEVEDEYRRAGILHKYDPDTELEKRIARVARKYPQPAGLMPEIEDCLKILDDYEKKNTG